MVRVVQWSAWFGPLLALWLLVVGIFTADALVVGIVAAALAASFALLIHVRGLLGYTLAPRTAAAELRAVARLPLDFGLIAWALVRPLAGGPRVEGALVERPYPYETGDSPRARGHRTVVVSARSLAPNSI